MLLIVDYLIYLSIATSLSTAFFQFFPAGLERHLSGGGLLRGVVSVNAGTDD
jgi:hypothetical protein